MGSFQTNASTWEIRETMLKSADARKHMNKQTSLCGDVRENQGFDTCQERISNRATWPRFCLDSICLFALLNLNKGTCSPSLSPLSLCLCLSLYINLHALVIECFTNPSFGIVFFFRMNIARRSGNVVRQLIIIKEGTVSVSGLQGMHSRML